MKSNPNIPSRLLWEFDVSKFNFDISYKVVIERVLERGDIADWKEIVRYYSLEQIKETIEWSAQLSDRDKDFARFFIYSDMLHV
jgi:hypothetical protein